MTYEENLKDECLEITKILAYTIKENYPEETKLDIMTNLINSVAKAEHTKRYFWIGDEGEEENFDTYTFKEMIENWIEWTPLEPENEDTDEIEDQSNFLYYILTAKVGDKIMDSETHLIIKRVE